MADAAGRAPLLVEIGTEELPPKALRGLSRAFADGVRDGLEAEQLSPGKATPYATPRRLAVRVEDVAYIQPGRATERRGPRLDIAFDAAGNPTPAALGFARSCGVEVTELEPLETAKGAWLAWRGTRAGEPAAALLPGIVTAALASLPLPRRMRWSDLDVEFIRPVHWALLLFGEEVIDAEILGVRTGRATRGHRFHHPDEIPLRHPDDYAGALREPGRVVADFDERLETIRAQAGEVAAARAGRPEGDEALLEEVAALVEWPVALLGTFEDEFLALPDPVLRATMKGHQRYFPVTDEYGRLLPHFVTVANIESRNPETVRAGNERVIRPRLRDAEFFFREDLKTPLAERREELKRIVFQEGLGSLQDKSQRVSLLAGRVAEAMGLPEESVRLAHRAGLLCKCDLVTEIVGEFPELQGIMGAEYARGGSEPETIADAIREHYLPGFAGDALPGTALGQALAIADRLDTLIGIFDIGQAPSGDRDPFGLRRAALGVLRILIEGKLDLDLERLLAAAAEGYSAVPRPLPKAATPPQQTHSGTDGTTSDDLPAPEPITPLQEPEHPGLAKQDTPARVGEFLVERLRAYFAEQGVPVTVFAAVHARRPARPLDFARRVHAVDAFRRRPEAASLAAANKRIGNILRQAGHTATHTRRYIDDPDPEERSSGSEHGVRIPDSVVDRTTVRIDEAVLPDPAESELREHLDALEPNVRNRLAAGDYTAAMQLLATLRDDVDAFFDTVLVMDEDERVRANRLALLAEIHSLFLETADISLLQDR